MCKVQERAKHERQNDDYATTKTPQNSSSLNDNAHHIRRRLSQTITSRHCLLIAIALALPSAHACGDTVELQVTCDSGKATWVVPSSGAIYENTTVTVGSCINGRVADIAQVKGKDIDDKGIVLCAKQSVCYHLIRPSGGQIEAKDCDNYDDPNRTYHCDNGVLKFSNDKSHDITASDTCFSSNNVSNNYGCDGNIVRKTPCPNGCADDHQGCKQDPDLTDKCTPNDTPICEGKMIKICKDQKWESTVKRSICQKVNGSSIMYECQDNGEAPPTKTTCPLGCDENGDKCKRYICKSGKQYECKDGTLLKCGNAQDVATQVANNMTCDEENRVVFCDKNDVKSRLYICANDKVAWCKQNESIPLQTECLPSSPKDNLIACNNLNNSRRSCDKNGDILPEESCSNGQTKCADDLKGRVDCDGEIIEECQYCYNESIENNFTTIEKLGCGGCVPNEYNFGDSSESLFNTMNSICYNGKESKYYNIENRNFLFIPELNKNKNGLWEFALNVTPALSKDLSVVPANDQSKQTWRYYNCYNNAAMKFLNGLIKSDDANVFLESVNKSEDTIGENVIDSKVSKTCCDDENSYYITQTGYRYYSVEKCTNIRLHDTNKDKIIATKFSAYAYTPELNGSLIGVEDDLLAKDYACLEVRDKTEDTNDVRHMVFIKQQPDGKSNYGIYKAFECPENYKCDLKNRYKGLCISENENVPSNSDCSCNNNTIMCGSDIIAACPEGTTPSIVGDSGQSSCDGQIFSLDQIRCVPDGKSTAKQ